MTTACPQQLLYTHRPSPPSIPLLLTTQPIFATTGSVYPPLPRKTRRGFGARPLPCLVPSPRRQLAAGPAQPWLWARYHTLIFFGAQAYFSKSPCPMSVFSADYLRTWHFPCLNDLLPVGSPPKAQLGTTLFYH